MIDSAEFPDFKTAGRKTPGKPSPGIVGKLYRKACEQFDMAATSGHVPTEPYHLAKFDQPGFKKFLEEACRLRDLYNLDLLALLKEASQITGSEVTEAGLMVGAWGHALGWRRGTYERDELFKLRFRGLRAWARREFDRVVAANRSDDEKENETIKLKLRQRSTIASTTPSRMIFSGSAPWTTLSTQRIRWSTI